MNTLTVTVLIIIALSGFPLGILLRHLTKEEIIQGRKYFISLIVLCIIAIFTSIIAFKEESLIFLCTSFIFIILLTLPSVIKLKRKR